MLICYIVIFIVQGFQGFLSFVYSIICFNYYWDVFEIVFCGIFISGVYKVVCFDVFGFFCNVFEFFFSDIKVFVLFFIVGL